ncbi:ankyrin [Trypanosoma conorhini]|uniref:Ankyrin n=1 Tax=Trypanosoma conorhini TaxID=83891 RepID=A0A3R7NSB3_9TRYP|nr:ankyrin [Trypanosoma conorhini]RNF26294.1 ankyrin [Trypanosoma conorhini]
MERGDDVVGAAFRQACQHGDLAAVQDFLRHGCALESAPCEGCTGLWLAAEAGRTEVVAFLCSKGANTNVARSPGGATALFVASQNGHTAVARLLLQFGADPNLGRDTGATPVFIAAQQGHLDLVRLLLDGGGNPATPNYQGVSPIMVAAHQGNFDCVQLLRGKGCDPCEVAMGRNKMEWAEAKGHGKDIAHAVMQGAVTHPGLEISEGKIPRCTAAAGGGNDSSGWNEQEDGALSTLGRMESETGEGENGRQEDSTFSLSKPRTGGIYEPQYLLRGRHPASSLSAVSQNPSREAVQGERERSKAPEVSSRGGVAFRASVGRLKFLVRREEEENESFRARQRGMLQTHHPRRVAAEPPPIDAQEIEARWEVWKRTLYEKLR